MSSTKVEYGLSMMSVFINKATTYLLTFMTRSQKCERLLKM